MTALRRFLVILVVGIASATARADMPNFDPTPDRPEAFGYKINWFVVRASDPASVANALEVGPGTPANWASGMAAAYGRIGANDGRSWIFLSPPVKQWVFVVGSSLPYPVTHNADRHRGIGQKFDTVLERLTRHFPEVQFFGSHRVVGFVAWARAQTDKPTRVFAFGDGDVYANIGDQTEEEASLQFLDLSGLSPHAASERLFGDGGMLPDEADVLRLAALWGLDPEHLPEVDSPMGVGLVVELPNSLAQ